MTALRRLQLEEKIDELMAEVENKKEGIELLEIAIGDLEWEIRELVEELGA